MLFDLCMKGNVVKRLGLLFAALYLKQCSVHLQRYYGGDEREVSDPPVFVSLSRTGIPTIIPIHHRHIIAGKGERGDRLVRLYLSWFSICRIIKLAKPIGKSFFEFGCD